MDCPEERLRRLELAAAWLQRLHEQVRDQVVVEQWLDWCESDPRNQQAFDELAAVWDLTGELRQSR